MAMPARIKRPGRRTIARDLIVGLSLTIAFVVVVIGAFSYAVSVREANAELVKKAEDVAEKLATILAQPLWTIEHSEIERIAHIYLEKDQVVALRILDEDGEAIYERHEADEPDLIAEERAITYDGRPIGTIEVAFTRQHIHELKRRILWATLALVVGVILAAVLAVHVLLLRYLNVPLRRLERGIDVIAGGHYRHRLTQVDQAEVNAIIQRVNVMAEAIQSREDQLQHAKVELEGRFEERTAALRRSNAQLRVEVAERKRVEAALRAAKEAAEKATQARGRFLADMSHEIRTPMSGVIGMTNVLLETPLSDEQREFVEVIRSSGDALLTIINDILDLSKIEAGRIDLEREAFDLRACLGEAVDLLSPRAREKGLRLAVHVDPQVPAFVVSDATRLRQILVNLVSNAVKFTEQGEVVVSVRAAEARDGVCELHFAVRDTGIGIEPGQIDRLFDPFMQSDAPATRRRGGTGLGLSISKKLSELMGGTIGARSEPGVGSTFFFTIRAGLVSGDGQATPPPLQADPPGDPKSPGDHDAVPALRILLAEDNVVNQKVALHMLGRLGYRADVASSGREAVEAVGRRSYDVVLMDMQMPVMDGLQATQCIRKDLPAARQPHIIALTANAMNGDRERCLEAGMDDYLSKPVKLEDLRDALTRAAARQLVGR